MKKVVYILLSIVSLWIAILFINLFLMFSNLNPLIYYKTVEYVKDDTHIIEYHSLGYKIIFNEKGWIKNGSIHFLWTKTAPDVEYRIIDETEENCVSGKTYFYENEHFKYYFNCNKKIYLEFKNKKMKLEDALNQGKVTMESLKKNGLIFSTESKVQYTMELNVDSSCKFLEGDETKLIKKSDNLYYYCTNNVNIYVNKNYSSFEQAYNNTIKLDSITVSMKKDTSYESGAIMYSGNGFKLLQCSNGSIVLGPIGLEYFDIFCK